MSNGLGGDFSSFERTPEEIAERMVLKDKIKHLEKELTATAERVWMGCPRWPPS
jgi:hypothetical protein